MGHIYNDPDRYGLKSIPNKPPVIRHKCSLPGEFQLFIEWVMNGFVDKHWVYRCECGEVWANPFRKWIKAPDGLWLAAGGTK